MKLAIDSLISATGWVLNAPSTITEIEEKKYIAGLNAKSLMISFSATDLVKTATKTFGTPFDVTDYDTLVFNIWSRDYGADKLYIKPSDFSYKIKINNTAEYYIPVNTYMNDVNIGIEEITSITQIEIIALHTTGDYIIISEMIAEKEEIAYDILTSVKEHIEYFLNLEYPNGVLLGTASGTTGDNTIDITNPNYLDRYGVIKIDGGGNNEEHQVEDNDSVTYHFNDNYDGNALLNDYTNANIYLQFPVEINPGQQEMILPGIVVWGGFDPEPILRGAKLDTERESFTDSGSKERLEGQIYQHSILLDCEARSHELIDIMTKYVKMFIGRESLWINGRRHDIYFDGAPTEMKPDKGIDFIPKVQYRLSVEVKESLYERTAVPITSTINLTVDVQED